MNSNFKLLSRSKQTKVTLTSVCAERTMGDVKVVSNRLWEARGQDVDTYTEPPIKLIGCIDKEAPFAENSPSKGRERV